MPISLTHKTNDEILSRLKTLRGNEVRSQVEILWHLHEVSRREMDKERGSESLYEFAMMEFGYSKNESYLRIRAAEILGLYPDLEEDLLSYRLCQTSLMLAQIAFRQEDLRRRKLNLERVSTEEKITVLDRMRRGSVNNVKLVLAECFPELKKDIEETKPLKDGRTQIKFGASPELMAMFERLKDQWAHTNFDRKWEPFFMRMAEVALEKFDRKPKQRVSKPAAAESRPAAEPAEMKEEQTELPLGLPVCSNRRHVPAEMRRSARERAGDRCQYVDPERNWRCTSTHGLQLDHILPLALGGENTIANARMMCPAHNRHAAHKLGLRRPASKLAPSVTQ